MVLVSRLRLDAVLHDPPGPRPKGKRGPQPKKGARQKYALGVGQQVVLIGPEGERTYTIAGFGENPNVATAAVVVPLLRAGNAINVPYAFAKYLYAPPQRNSILGMVASYLLAGTEAYWSVRKGSVWWLSNRAREGGAGVVLKAALGPDFL